MAFNIFRRRKQLRERPPTDIGDVEVGFAVRVAWGGPLGWVKWINEKHGTAGVHWDYQAPGLCEIIQLKFPSGRRRQIQRSDLTCGRRTIDA